MNIIRYMLIVTYYINYVSDVYTNFLYKLFYKFIKVDAYFKVTIQKQLFAGIL